MTKYLSYIKQSTSFNVGHIYEHLLMSSLEKKAYDKGFLRGVDYSIRGETYDGIVLIAINTNISRLLTEFKETLLKLEIVDKNIYKAINEICCEYSSSFKCDFNLLKRELTKFNKLKWLENDNFIITNPITEAGWSIKDSSIISFNKTKKTDFDMFSFVYNFKNIDFELKPLAVYLAQFLALSQIDALYNRTPEIEACYDQKDEWAEWQFEHGNNIVGYAHYMSFFSRQKMSVKKLEQVFNRNYKEIISKNFVKKLVEFLLIESCSNHRYFCQKEMVKNSGAIIGKKWFKKYCSTENINTLLDNLEVIIEKEK